MKLSTPVSLCLKPTGSRNVNRPSALIVFQRLFRSATAAVAKQNVTATQNVTVLEIRMRINVELTRRRVNTTCGSGWVLRSALPLLASNDFSAAASDKTSIRILIQLPIFVTDKSGIIQICEIRQKHPRGQRLKLEQANK